MENRNMDEQIEKTISSLDGLVKVEVPGFLYTKVKAKLARRKEKENFPLMIFLKRPALSIAALFLTAMLNLYIILQEHNYNNNTATKEDVSMQAFAKEYGMVSYSAYDK